MSSSSYADLLRSEKTYPGRRSAAHWTRVVRCIPGADAPGILRNSVARISARTRLVLRFVDSERAAVKILSIQRLHRPRGIRTGHLDEAEAAGTTRLPIVDQRERLNSAMGGEQIANGIFGCREGKIADV